MERRTFGQLPQTVELALANLPNQEYPLLEEDESFQHLYALRRAIGDSITHYLLGAPFPDWIFPRSDLDKKMVPLTPEDVSLMEKLSFRRDKLIGVLPFLPPDLPDVDEKEAWATYFSHPGKEPWLNVWKMIPWSIEEFPLVLIEEHEPEDPEFPFTMGVVTPEEYVSLTRKLD